MPRLKLTDTAISKMRAPDPSGRQVLFWDTELKGFGLLVSGKTKAKTYIAQRDLPNGRTRRVTVGSVAELDLEKAREEAADRLHEMRKGLDPKARVGGPTLRDALEAYIDESDLRPGTVYNYRLDIERRLADWLDLRLRAIDVDMVQDRHSAIAREIAKAKGKSHGYHGKGAANSTMRALRAVWNWTFDGRDDAPPCPVKLRKRWHRLKPRKRRVRAGELPAFCAAVSKLENAVVRDYILFLLLTGLRRREASALAWNEVDLAGRAIRIPAGRLKADRDLELPVTDQLLDLLVRRQGDDPKWVFPAGSRSGHL